MINKKIIIASRNSNLAKTQTELVVSKLKYAGYKNIEKIFLKSKGDISVKPNLKSLEAKVYLLKKLINLL